MKKWTALILVFFVGMFLVACGGSLETVSSSDSSEDTAYFAPTEELEPPAEVDSQITETLMEVGYTVDQATEIQKILNTVGVTSIVIDNYTGEAQSGLNSVVCYPNGLEDENRRFYFTTDDGRLFYAGFSDEDLYDSAAGGFLKSYEDVYVPETKVTIDVFTTLQGIADEAVRGCLKYPDSAHFDEFSWSVGRSDNVYKILGKVSAENSFSVSDEVYFAVWFTEGEEGFSIDAITLDGVRVK